MWFVSPQAKTGIAMFRLLPGVLFGLVAGFGFAQFYGKIELTRAISAIVSHYSLLVVAGLSVFLTLVAVYIFRDIIARWLFGVSTREWDKLVTDASAAVDDIIEKRYGDLKERLTETTQSVVATAVMWAARATLMRFFLAIIVASASAFGTYVLVQQNTILNQQTGLLQSQATLAETQIDIVREQTKIAVISSHLQTASRRAVYAPEVSSIVASIDAQTNEAMNLGVQPFGTGDGSGPVLYENGVYLSDELIGRILTILPLLTPYVTVGFDTSGDTDLTNIDNISLRYLSPERGTILRALITNHVILAGLTPSDMSGAATTPNFQYADMRNFTFDPDGDTTNFECRVASVHNQREHEAWSMGLYDLTPIDTSYADWSGARLSGVRFSVTTSIVEPAFSAPLSLQRSKVIYSGESFISLQEPLPEIEIRSSSIYVESAFSLRARLSSTRIAEPCPNSILLEFGRSRRSADDISAQNLANILSGLVIFAPSSSDALPQRFGWEEILASIFANFRPNAVIFRDIEGAITRPFVNASGHRVVGYVFE